MTGWWFTNYDMAISSSFHLDSCHRRAANRRRLAEDAEANEMLVELKTWADQVRGWSRAQKKHDMSSTPWIAVDIIGGL